MKKRKLNDDKFDKDGKKSPRKSKPKPRRITRKTKTTRKTTQKTTRKTARKTTRKPKKIVSESEFETTVNRNSIPHTIEYNTPNVKIKSITECVDSKKGLRQYQEDRYVSIAQEDIPISLFAIMDGHGGTDVSSALVDKFKSLIPIFLNDRTIFDNKNKFKEEMIKQFIKIDQDMKKEGKKAGSTAVVAIVDVERKSLYLVNLGDSRALVMQNGEIIEVTKDMKPNNPDERKRITNLGGKVTSDNSGHRVMGVLAVSRAFGDYDLKPYVSNEPEIYGPINVKTKTVIVLATDGLWDEVTNNDVKTIVNKHDSYKELCEVLTDFALKKKSADNVTVMTATIS